MDSLLEKFTSAFVTNQEESQYSYLFKNWGRDCGQEERRRTLLETQKRNRNEGIDKHRGILDIVQAVEMDMEWSEIGEGKGYCPSKHVPGFHRNRPSYRKTLMMSEWMMKKPDDLETNWYLMLCPKGTRCIVIAHKGKTLCFNKVGKFMHTWKSLLPGGYYNAKRDVCCVLDCVWSDKVNVMYVLDLLAWNNQAMTDCDTEFRHYWLKTQFAEKPLLSYVCKKNEVKFEVLPKHLCTKDNLNEFISKYPAFPNNLPALDGVLFYHRESSYTSGSTPLVTWLYPYMLEEILNLGLNVNENYMKQKPEDYTNQKEYVIKFEEKRSKKNKSRKNSETASNKSSEKDNANMNKAETLEAKPVEVITSGKGSEIKVNDEKNSNVDESMN